MISGRRSGVRYTHIQRQIQTDNIALRQQLIKRDILRAGLHLLTQPRPVMIYSLHPKHLSFRLQIPSDAAHAQDPERLALRVVAQSRGRVSAPFAFSEGVHARVEVAEGADDEEHVDVCGCVVDGCGHVGDQNGW